MTATLVIEVRVSCEPVSEVRMAPHGVKLNFPSARASALAAIKAEAMRLATNGTREGFKFAERLFEAIPELRSE